MSSVRVLVDRGSATIKIPVKAPTGICPCDASETPEALQINGRQKVTASLTVARLAIFSATYLESSRHRSLLSKVEFTRRDKMGAQASKCKSLPL